ncbi:MAG: hypothetical protein ACP5RC_13595 [Halothiobacillaceae bacterium]
MPASIDDVAGQSGQIRSLLPLPRMRTEGEGSPELQVTEGQFRRLVCPRPAVIEKEQQGMITLAQRGVLVRLIEQGIDLSLFEIADQCLCRLLERNRANLCAPREVDG